MVISRVINKIQRIANAAYLSVLHPLLFRAGVRNFIDFIHLQSGWNTALLNPIVNSRLPLPKQGIRLQNCFYSDGNVSPAELMIIASLVAFKMPKNLLEIGTFDGNTALQMVINSPDDAVLHTIDLEEQHLSSDTPLASGDLKFVLNTDKKRRKYLGTESEKKIVQHFGDSTTYDFQKFIQSGLIDFAFIDGGHSEQCVRSDTENTLKILSPEGIIVWHDYAPGMGVYNYLNELSKSLYMFHIQGTQLALYSQKKLV